MYLFYVTKIVLTTYSVIVLHVSVLCDNNCPRYSQCYIITCICSMWQKLSSLLAVLYYYSITLSYYSQCYSITCICSMWQKLSSLLAVLYYYMYLFYVTKIVLTTYSVIVLHVSVLCDKNCPRYSQCYSITCICSMWQILSSLLAVL